MSPRSGRALLVAAAAGALLLNACASDRQAVSAPPFGTGTTVAALPPTGSEAPAATSEAIPVESVAMVGDSITVGAQPALEAGLAELGLPDVEIDAENGRRMLVDGAIGSGIEAVERLADEGSPDLWVIALGTNDVGNYTYEQYPAAIGELLAAIPPDAPVVWVDTYLEGLPDESAAFNAVLRYLLTARGRATIVDWASVAPDDGVLSDGIHPTDQGVEQFAALVVAAVDAWQA